MRDAVGLLAFVGVASFFGMIATHATYRHIASECLKHGHFTADSVTFQCVKQPAQQPVSRTDSERGAT